jgi:DNA adenine methylase
MIPKHKIYVEVFGGSGKVLLNKPKSKLEVWNDYDRRIANLFHVVVFKFDEFYEKIKGLVYSRELYKQYSRELKEVEQVEIGDVDMAVKTYYVLRCTFSGGRSGFNQTGFRFARKENIAMRYWMRLRELEHIRERLSGVVIECDDFEKVMKRWDGENVFMYLDPPYYGTERYYEGFSRKDHERLLSLLKQVKGKWLLSGYANELYDRELVGYNRFEFNMVRYSYHKTGNNEEYTKPKAKEVLWCNYDVEKENLLLNGLSGAASLYNAGEK